MVYTKDIVCLANSRKSGEYCFAGKEVLPDGGYGEWIRPVSERDGGAISKAEQTFADGNIPKLLDVVRIPFVKPEQALFQPENHLIHTGDTPDCRWELVGRVGMEQLPDLLDDVPDALWMNKGGKTDRVPHFDTKDLHTLLLIQPDSDSLSIFTVMVKFNGKEREQVRAKFDHNGHKYDLVVTDPVAENKHRGNDQNIATDNVYLCISLGEGIDPRNNGEWYRYKLVAGMIEENDSMTAESEPSVDDSTLPNLYTIGHSTHPIDYFIGLLKLHGVDAVCDVRSNPRSGYMPQYNRENIKRELNKNDIRYVFLGKELGARSDNPDCYTKGKVQFDKLADDPLFKNGLKRVKDGLKEYTIALMCAEEDPLRCHRMVLVTRHLRQECSVKHIRGFESNAKAEQRLVELHENNPKQERVDDSDPIDLAYEKQGRVIAYVRKDNTQ